MRVDHRIATDPKRKCTAVLRSVNRTRVERNVSFNVLLVHCGHAGWDLAIDWNIGDSNLLHRRNQRPCFSRLAVDETFSLQHGDVLHNRCLTRETKMILNFASAGCESFFTLFVLDELKNIALPVGEHKWMMT